MKREKVYVDERRERIRDILREKSQVRVEALAEGFCDYDTQGFTVSGRAEAADPGIRRCSCSPGTRGADGRNPAVPGFDCALCGQSGRGRRYTVS